MEKLTLAKFRKIIQRHEKQATLNFHLNIDADKRIHADLSGKYENVFEMNGEFMLVTSNGKEYFRNNKYANLTI